jgi:hypothetical protein
MLEYLRSGRRQPIQNSYDLLELIISQSVGILHRADVIPDLDFLKIFGSRANWAVSITSDFSPDFSPRMLTRVTGGYGNGTPDKICKRI